MWEVHSYVKTYQTIHFKYVSLIFLSYISVNLKVVTFKWHISLLGKKSLPCESHRAYMFNT